MTTVWLRNVGDEDECWVPCARGDVGATAFMPASQLVHTNRLNDDLVKMNSDLIANRNALVSVATDARNGLASLPAEILGIATDPTGEPVQWPIRDELLHRIDQALALTSQDRQCP